MIKRLKGLGSMWASPAGKRYVCAEHRPGLLTQDLG